MRFTRIISLLSIMLALSTASVWAQFETASILGTVTDSSGAALVGVKVSVINEDTGISISRITDKVGEYRVPALRAGSYRVVAAMDGFQTSAVEQVSLLVGTNQMVNLTLQIGAAAEEIITVDAGREVLETETSHKQQVVTSEAIDAFPLKDMDYTDLMNLSIGVSQDAAGQDLGTSSVVREGAYNIDGQRSTYNNYLLDGMDNNAHGTSNQGFSNQIIQPSAFNVAQFSIVTTLPPAEYGRAAGGTINVSFKQGANKMYGMAYESLRNTLADANGFFKAASNSGSAHRTTLNRNQFGFNLGGALKRDRFFYFLDYEGLRQVRQTVNQSNIFKESDHQLIASPNATANTTYVLNPFTGDQYAADRPLPRTVLSPIALAILDAFPLPNNNGAGASSISSNWSTLQRFLNSYDKEDIRLDAQWTPRMSSFVRLSQSKEHDRDGATLPAPFSDSNAYIRTINQQLAFGLTRQIKSSQLLEARLGISYTKGGKHPDQIGDTRTFGVQGLPTDASIWGGLTTISLSGYSTFGRQPTNPQWQYPFFLNPKVTYSWMKGHHNLKSGYEMSYLRQTVQDVNPIYGQLSFSSSFTGYIISDFLFGVPNEIDMTNLYVAHIRQGGHAGFIQDDWKLLPRLTLNMGVRYEYASHFYEKDSRLSNFSPDLTPVTGQLIRAASSGSIYQRQLINPDLNDFMPRFGFAYSPQKNLVMHGGYGIGFIHYTRSGEADNLALNGPQLNQAVYNQVPKYFKTANAKASSTFFTLDQGYPQNMASPANFNLYTSAVKWIPKDYCDPYVQSWYLGVQYGIMRSAVVDVSYVGNHGVKQQEVGDYNQRNPDLGLDSVTGYYLRPHANIGDVIETFNGGTSKYNGLQARFEVKQFHGIWILNAFTWSRSIANVGDPLTSSHGFSGNPQDYYHLQNDHGPSQYDLPIMNNTSVSFKLPVGRHGLILRHVSKRTDNLIGGWKLTAYNQYHSGPALTPNFTPTGSQELSNSGGVQYRPYFATDSNGNSLRSTAIQRLHVPDHKEAAFCDTVYATLYGCTVGFAITAADPRGDVPNGVLRGDSFWQLDAGLNKTFGLPWDHTKVEFRGQFYNVLNKTNFTTPGMTCCSTSFGRITSTYGPGRIGQIQALVRF